MINWNKLIDKSELKSIIKKNWKKIIFAIIIIMIVVFYMIIIHNYIQKINYTKNVIKIARRNENPVFSVEKVYVCSSANAIEKSSTLDNKKFDIYQYTDMAISLNNFREEKGITKENTVKELYIDNIDLKVDGQIGNQSLKYTNLMKIGSREAVTDFSKRDRIDFKIVYTNAENKMANYDSPTFYTDCSNPISLKYINDLGSDYSVDKNSSVNFDGSILKKAGIAIEDINARVKFKINIVNNNDEYFSCWINLNMPLDKIYNGTSIKSTTPIDDPRYYLFKS